MVEQNINRPSIEELKVGLEMLKNRKAPEADYIMSQEVFTIKSLLRP